MPSTSNKKAIKLPGDYTLEDNVAAMIRVNHAGEYGAGRIYAGQMSVLKDKESKSLLQHMADQEKTHLQTFEKLIVERGVRPTLFLPVWHVAGFALGAITAMMGKKTAMLCTVAVEETIDEHYSKQLKALSDSDSELSSHIAKFRDDEREHKDTANEHQASEAPFAPIVASLIRLGSKAAIFLSHRI